MVKQKNRQIRRCFHGVKKEVRETIIVFNEADASIETLVRIANALQVSTDELLDDNLEDELIASSRAFEAVLADCNEYEKRVLLDMVSSMKKAIRDNSSYWPKTKK